MSLVLTQERLAAVISGMPDIEKNLSEMSITHRVLSEMKGYYRDMNKCDLEDVIYDVLSWPENGRDTDLLITITVLYPGHVNNEHFHTKGHFHNDPDGPEFVLGYKGRGRLEMGNRNGQKNSTVVESGTHVWVPPGTAHRMVNETEVAVTYLSISSAGVGHDYDSVASLGWKHNH